MSYLDKLIKQHCPDGVETKKLEECCTILDRKRKPVTKGARVTGEYPYYGANGIQDYVSDFIFDGVFVLVGEDGSVITPEGTPVVNWATGKIWVNNHAHIIEEKPGVMLRYLYHYIQTVDVTPLIHGNIPKLTGRDFKAIAVPVPPLEVQREIVHVLDSFTLLTAELTAELTARKKQYEFYRDCLLSEDKERESVQLSDIADVIDSLHQTPQYVNEGYPMIRVVDVKNSIIDTDVCYKVDEDTFNSFIRKYKPQRNDIVISRVGSYGNVGLIDVDDACLGQNVALIHTEKCNPKYLFYYLGSSITRNFIDSNVNGASQKSLSLSKIKEIPIPKLSIEEQNKIVSVLDNFNAICTDLNIGLPAEIQARKQQYEFYREAILTYATTGEIISRQTDRQTDRT